MSTWTDTGRAGRWFVNDNKAMVVRVEGLGDAWLFTHEFPDGELRSYWGRLILGPGHVIGSQGRSARNASPFPHSPFNPCVRFSRTRLTDGLIDMVTLPWGSGLCP